MEPVATSQFNAKDFLNSINNTEDGVYIAVSDNAEEKQLQAISNKVSVFTNGAFFQVDIAYDDTNKEEILSIWNKLNDFISEKSNKFKSDDNIYISISPNIYDQKYCLFSSDPVMWTLTSASPDEVPSVLRIIFPLDFTGIYEFAGLADDFTDQDTANQKTSSESDAMFTEPNWNEDDYVEDEDYVEDISDEDISEYQDEYLEDYDSSTDDDFEPGYIPIKIDY